MTGLMPLRSPGACRARKFDGSPCRAPTAVEPATGNAHPTRCAVHGGLSSYAPDDLRRAMAEERRKVSPGASTLPADVAATVAWLDAPGGTAR